MTRINALVPVARVVSLALVLAGLVALAGPAAPGARAATADRVGLCHVTGAAGPATVFIEVNAHAVDAHLAHGDNVAPDGAADCTPLPTNTNPTAVDDVATTAEDTAVAIAVLANDTDAEGHALTVTAVDALTAAGGTAVPNADGTVTYTPPADFGGIDAFTYTISDGHSGTDTATVTITVEAGNDAPEARQDFAFDEVFATSGTFQQIPVLANDIDRDGDPLILAGIAVPPTAGELFIHDDGTISYMQPADPCVAGEDTFTYTVADGRGGTDTAEVAIRLYNGGTPVVSGGAYATAVDTSILLPAVQRNDGRNWAWSLTLTFISDPLHGDVTFDNYSALTYTPEPGFVGTDQFTFELVNQYGCGASASVTVTVG